MRDLELPFFVNFEWVLSFLLVAILILHAALIWIRPWRLTHRCWTKVEYLVLALGALGLVGTVETTRREIATSMAEKVATADALADYRWLLTILESHAGPTVCRRLEPSPYWPRALELIQEEYDRACERGRKLYQMAARNPTMPPPIPEIPRLALMDWWLVEKDQQLVRAVEQYGHSVARIRKFERAAQRTMVEFYFFVFSPYLLAAAIALQATKVTAALRYDESETHSGIDSFRRSERKALGRSVERDGASKRREKHPGRVHKK